MKLIALITAFLLTSFATAIAAPPTSIDSYFSNSVVTQVTFADAGDTGLETNTVYICIEMTTLTNSEYTATLVTNDVRPFMSAMIKELAAEIQAKPSTNRFTTFTIEESTAFSGPTNRVTRRTVKETQELEVTPSYPGN